MRSAKIIIKALIPLFLVGSVLSQAVLVGDPENPEYRNAEKQHMKTSGVILEVCVYEQEFQPSEHDTRKDPNGAPWTSGKMVKRAVVVGVHKGDVKVGTKIEIVEVLIDPPEYFSKFRSTVEGELLTYFYYGEELPKAKEGRHVVNHNQMYFKRDKDKDVVAFLERLRSDPAQNIRSEQDGTGQPATRPESKSEGSDKPQPESEGRSR